jgi:CRISPR/Cas system-associated exonuclease Cas4 (RecB family)
MLPPNFTFNQLSLQAFKDCPRRFWLAYIEQLPWPAVEASPVQEHEELSRQGKRFHRLVERTEIGMDADHVASQIDQFADPALASQYAAYLAHRPRDLPTAVHEVELMLSTALPLGDQRGGETPVVRLVAQYDLVAAEERGRVVIIDWKTGRRVPSKPIIQEHMQSVLYPFVLVEASAGLPWGPVRPEQVEMRYWFTAAPEQPMVFPYDGAQHDRIRVRLQKLIDAIERGKTEADFPKVEDTPANRRRFCAFCVYRSRCDRGTQAGDVEEMVDPTDFFSGDVGGSLEFTLDEVEEIAF